MSKEQVTLDEVHAWLKSQGEQLRSLRAAIDRNQQEVFQVLGRMEQHLPQPDPHRYDWLHSTIARNHNEIFHRCSALDLQLGRITNLLSAQFRMVQRELTQHDNDVFHRFNFFDVRLGFLDNRLRRLDVQLDRLDGLVPEATEWKRKLCGVAMRVSFIVSIFTVFSNPTLATYLVGLAVFFALVMRLHL
jgi:hypothetical protein